MNEFSGADALWEQLIGPVEQQGQFPSSPGLRQSTAEVFGHEPVNTRISISVHTESPGVAQVFPGIPVLSSFLAESQEMVAVHIQTLLFVLKNHITLLTIDRTHPDIYNLLLGPPSLQHAILVATTQNPCHNPLAPNPTMDGFRILGRLSDIVIQPASMIDAFQEHAHHHDHVVAVHGQLSGPPAADIAAFHATWRPYGITLTHHFVLVLHKAARPQALVPSGFPSAEIASTNLEYDLVPSHIASSEPLPIAPSERFPITLAGVVSGQAVYEAGQRMLVQLVRNFYAMASVIIQLGLPDYHMDPRGLGSISLQTSDTLFTVDVLRSFGWSPKTYSDKSTWYGWAEHAALQHWVGPVPKVTHPDYRLYNVWRGIVFIWKDTAILTSDVLPSQESLDPDEVAASHLTQRDIVSCRVEISRKLV